MRSSAKRRSLRVVINDPQALFRAGLGQLIQRLGAKVGVTETADTPAALRLLGRRPGVDLVLTDLPPDGAGGLKKLVRAAGAAPVVVVCANDRIGDVQRATAAGARGLVPKSSPPEVLLAALRLVLAGGLYLPPAALGVAPRPRGRGLAEAPARYESQGSLTPRQRQVVDLVAEGKSNVDIARALGLSPGTVKIHMTRIFRTLGVKSRTQALVATGRVG